MNRLLMPLISKLPIDVDPVSRSGVLLIERLLREQFFDEMRLLDDEEMNELFPLTHRFADGVYARELFLPAGTIVVGKIHKYAHLNVITQGRCIVLTEFGAEELAAPYTFISKPGTKRVVAAVQDTVWTTFHGVNEHEYDDVDAIERRIICKTFDDFDSHQLSLITEN